MHLTLAQARQLAIQNNPEFASARLSAAATYEVPKELRSAMLPTASGLISGVGADSGSRLAAGALNNPVVYNRLGTGFSVSQLITDFGRTSDLVESSKLRASAADQATETTRANILLATSRAYFGLLRTEAVLTVATQTVAERQTVADQVTALAENNLKSTLDVSFANVNLAEARILLTQAQSDVKAATVELATAMGLPNETAFTLAEEPMPDPLPDRIEPLLQTALRDRPELKDLRLEQSAAERFAKAEHELNYPSLAVIGTAGLAPTADPAIPGRYGAIGLNVTIPVFNGGLFKARQNEAELRGRAIGQNVNDLANRVARDVRVAYLNAITALDRVGLTEQLLKQAQLALDLAQSRYNLGLSSIVELSQAQLNLTSAQIANTNARYEYQTERAVVDFQIGALR